MPNLKHNFTQGKMNKDLDERLVPNGQYRDALNIQISTSEGSDVGAVENVLGNTKQNKKTSSLNWDANFGLTSPKCIGVAKDTLNDKLYWFITATNGDAILEYNQSTGFIAPIIVDTRSTSILDFSASYKITAINILDDMLFWTDNNNEPRKLNISDYRTAAASSVGSSSTTLSGSSKTTEIYSRDFIASDITVIKKSPVDAAGVTASSTATGAEDQNGNMRGAGVNPIDVNAKLVDSNGYTLTEGDTVSIFWESAQGVAPLSAFNNKDVILSNTAIKSDGTKIKREAIGTLSSLTGITVAVEGVNTTFYTNATLTIISATPGMPTDALGWEMVLLEDEPIFKNDFPRFSYRWKYVDGEYSTYAPFSKAAFVTNKFSYEPEDGFNIGMSNNIRKITLSLPSDVPKGVEQIEILYKGVASNNVYVLDTHKTAAGALTTFVIEKDLLGPIVESLQLLRLYDDVPRKALSQEIIGNRVVYGNYLHNYPFRDEGLTITGSSTATAFTAAEKHYGFESVKTDRTYQIGVSFLDEFNRESPVFTTKEAAVKVNGENAHKKNDLRASVALDNMPAWADRYKYYVKDVTPEYYNLVLDRYYFAQDGNVWLSFPSAERNKVKEGDFITLKKKHGLNEHAYINNKYKIIDISNSAPDFIKRSSDATVSYTVQFATSGVSGDTLEFTGPTPSKAEKFVDVLTGGSFVQFRSTNGQKITELYRLANGGPKGDFDGTDNKTYKIELSNGEGLSANDAWLSGISTTTTVEMLVFGIAAEALPEFQGKFFAKVPFKSSFERDIKAGQLAEEYITINREVTGVIADMSAPTVSGGSQVLAYGNSQVASPAHDNNGPDDTSNTFDLHLYLGWFQAAQGDDDDRRERWRRSEAANTFNSIKIGKRIRFVNSSGDIGQSYLVTSISSVTDYDYTVSNYDHQYQKITVTVDRSFNDSLGADPSGIQIVKSRLGTVNAISNPAVFETEPNDFADVDIYYEATNALPAGSNGANLSNSVILDFKNCYTFGNGVESNRIRDDFNAPQKGKGVRVSTILQEPYYEERLPASLIYSGIVNSRSGINNSNQFTTAIDITKDLPNTYGGIQKLHARDTDLIALCEDKCFRILANKDALFNADGNTNVTSSNNVLGQTVPYTGEFGISKNPETFASYGFRTYFTDKSRGTVLRLSADGLTEIANAGVADYFEDKFKSHSGDIIGSYDEASGSYNVSFSGDESIAFKEAVSGWPTRLSFTPEFAASLNNEYYTIKNGELWEHSNTTRSNFYGTQESATVSPVINDSPSTIKNFKALSYEGDEGWSAQVTTSEQDGEVTSWNKREGKYFNFIKGKATTISNIDTSELAVQGLGELRLDAVHSSGSYTLHIDGPLNTSLQVGDAVYKHAGSTFTSLGPVASVNRSNGSNSFTTTLASAVSPNPADGDFILFVKDTEKNTSGLLGYYADVVMSTSSASKKELFSVNSEVFISSE